MKQLLLSVVAAAGLALALATAGAATIGVTGSNNSVIGAGVEGWHGATWFLTAGANTTIDVYLVGLEAGARNSSTLGTVTFGPYSNASGTGRSVLFGGTTGVTLAGSGSIAPRLIPFSFTTTFGGGASVTNAANPLPPNTPNFFSTVTTCGADILSCVFDTTVDGATALSGNTVLLALDDGGGRRNAPDDDHDDLVMVIRVSDGSVTLIPEPATLGLVGAGLLGPGLAAQRRHRA